MSTTKDNLRDLLNQMEGFVSTKTVIGEPVQLGNMMILPLVDVSLGVGAGSREKEKYGSLGGAIGAKMSPSAVLVIKDGNVRLVSIKNQDTVSKALDVVPELIDKLTGKNAAEDKMVKDKMAELAEKPEEKED